MLGEGDSDSDSDSDVDGEEETEPVLPGESKRGNRGRSARKLQIMSLDRYPRCPLLEVGSLPLNWRCLLYKPSGTGASVSFPSEVAAARIAR